MRRGTKESEGRRYRRAGERAKSTCKEQAQRTQCTKHEKVRVKRKTPEEDTLSPRRDEHDTNRKRQRHSDHQDEAPPRKKGGARAVGGCEQILEGGVETERCEAGAAVALLCCSAAKEKGAGREPAPLTQSVRARGGGYTLATPALWRTPRGGYGGYGRCVCWGMRSGCGVCAGRDS